MDKIRSPYWDNWKGLAIIAVVAIHSSDAAGTFPEDSFNWWFGLGFRQIVNYAVPLFLAISGYFAANSTDGPAITYYNKRLWRLITPYAIWTAIHIAARTPSDAPSISEVLKGYITGSGIGIGYYVIVLLQYIAFTPFLLKLKKLHSHVTIMCALTILGLTFSYYTRTRELGFISHFPGSALIFIVWYPFYHAGIIAALYRGQLKINKASSFAAFTAFFCALAAAAVESIYWATIGGAYQLGASQIKISSYGASLSLFIIGIIYLDRKTRLHARSPLTWLGRNSYAVYLTHMLPLSAACNALRPFEVIYKHQPSFIFIVMTLTIVSCSLFILTLRKALTPRISQIALG